MSHAYPPELQELIDKQAIRDLLAAYFTAADRHDNVKMAALYHDDATDDHGSFFKGLAKDFIATLPKIQEGMAILHHNMTTANIRIEGSYAEGEIYVLAFHQVKKEDGGKLDLLIGGRYFDKYEKRDGVWKFLHKAVVADWATLHDPSIVNLDNPIIEGSYIGKPGETDPSYGVFRLIRRGER